MIEIRNLTKKFGQKTLFENLNVTIQQGEFVIISGNSGCSKTTLLNIIGGIEPADAGSVLVNGYNLLKKFNKRQYYGEIVSFIFQNFVLIENKTVKQNFELINPKNRSALTFEEALKKVGLSDKLNEKVVIDTKKTISEKAEEMGKVINTENSIMHLGFDITSIISAIEKGDYNLTIKQLIKEAKASARHNLPQLLKNAGFTMDVVHVEFDDNQKNDKSEENDNK